MNDVNIQRVVFETTARCNLNCRYCYNIHKIPDGPKPLTSNYRQAKKTLTRLFRLAPIRQISMSGGEPFISDRFLELCLFCRMRDKKVLIISNGTAAEPEDYQTLAQIGVKTFEFPLHSPSAETHDAMTDSPGAWDKVRRSIDTVLHLGGTVVPMIVLTRYNYQRLGETLGLFKQLGLRRVMINRFNIGGNGIRHAPKLMLDKHQLRQSFAVADEMAEKYGLKISSNVCSPVCLLDPVDYPRIGFTKCSADLSRRPLTLDAKGNLRFCNHSPHRIGNIFSETLPEMFDSAYAKQWATSVPLICQNCDRWDDCFGGCRAASEQLGMPLSEVDPVLEMANPASH